MWRDNTSIAQYLKKGTKVLLEGQVDVKQYQRQDGTQGVGMTFRVSNLTLLGSNNNPQQNTQQQTTSDVSVGDDNGEILPF